MEYDKTYFLIYSPFVVFSVSGATNSIYLIDIFFCVSFSIIH